MVRTLWDRIVGRETENEASEKLVKALREHEKQWPEIEAAWQKADDEVVVPAAQVHSVALHTENPERILAAWEALMRARWDRDRAKGAWDRKRLALLGELEALTGPVIQEKWEYWQSSLAQLHGQRRIKEIERFVDMAFDHTPRRVRYKSNFPAIAEAKKRCSRPRRRFAKCATVRFPKSTTSSRKLRRSSRSWILKPLWKRKRRFRCMLFRNCRKAPSLSQRLPRYTQPLRFWSTNWSPTPNRGGRSG